jgi:hypothetical protein
LTATKAGLGSAKMGINAASSDSGTPLTEAADNLVISNGEIVHSTAGGPLNTTNGSGTASYTFTYTMPAGAAIGSVHTLYAVRASRTSNDRILEAREQSRRHRRRNRPCHHQRGATGAREGRHTVHAHLFGHRQSEPDVRGDCGRTADQPSTECEHGCGNGLAHGGRHL